MSRILMIDDDHDIVRAVCMRFHAAGHSTLDASNADDGIQLAIDNHPDLVILDVRMPNKDGFQALSELKKHPATKSIPVVVLSASVVDQELALDSGAECFVRKPYIAKHLLGTVDAAIASSHA